MAALGLRGKSLLALLLSCLLAFAFAGFIGYQALEGVQSRFGEAYAKNLVQLNRERVFAPVSRELALAQRLAGSQITLAWLQNEQIVDADTKDREIGVRIEVEESRPLGRAPCQPTAALRKISWRKLAAGGGKN